MDLSVYRTNNETKVVNDSKNVTKPIDTNISSSVDVTEVLRLILSSVGIIGNLTVLIIFLNHRKFRKKIPNIFIINQVRI